MTSLKVNLTVLGVVVVLAAGFGLGLLKPGLKKLDERRAKLAAETEQVHERQAQVGDVGELYAGIVQLEREVRDSRSRLPADRQFGEFLGELSENLKEAGLEEYTVEPKPQKTLGKAQLPDSLDVVDGTTILPVKVAFTGGFDNLIGFLERMEGMVRLSHVESLSLVNDEGRPGRISVELELHTYHRAMEAVQ